MKVQHVPIQYVNQTWSSVFGFLQAAIEQQTGDKDYTLDQVQAYVTGGQWVLLVAVEDDKIIGAATIPCFCTRSQVSVLSSESTLSTPSSFKCGSNSMWEETANAGTWGKTELTRI